MNARIRAGSLTAVLLLTAPAVAEVSPEVPQSALDTGRRVSLQMGFPAVGPPDFARVGEISSLTGQRVFQMGWDANLSVDEATGRVISFSASRSATDYPVGPAQSALTRDQAEAAALLVVTRGEFPPGDWRAVVAGYYHDPLELPDFRPQWTVLLFRFSEGHICDLDRATITLDAHDGKVESYRLDDTGIRLPAAGPILAEAQARQVAVAAFHAGGGPANAVPEMVWDTYQWLQVHNQSPLCRPAYRYRFQTQYMEADGSLVGPVFVDAWVDAVTGELWTIEALNGGPALFDGRRVKGARWLVLSAALLQQPQTRALGRALVAGGRVTARRPARSSLRFQEKLGTLGLEFACEPRVRRLAWREGGGPWQATTVPTAEFQRLHRWMRTQPPARKGRTGARTARTRR